MGFKRLQEAEAGGIGAGALGVCGVRWKVTLVTCKQMHTWRRQTRSVLADGSISDRQDQIDKTA